jgi:hypothetical protein
VTRLSLSFASIPVLLLWLGCTSSSAPDEGAAGDDSGATAGASGSGNNSGSGGTSSSNVRCPKGTNPKGPPDSVTLGVVSAQIVDEQGEPTSSGLVQVCGRDKCINADVADDGVLIKPVNQELDTPACKFGDGFTWAKLAIPLGKGDTDLGTLTTVRLPDYADGLPFTPGNSISSGGVTLTLDASAHIDIDELDYETEAEQGFRAVQLPADALAQLGQDFVVGFALSPLETRICPSPALSLENSSNLAPGTAVELYMLGLDAGEAWVPYGQWQKVSDGTVSDDGATLDFAEGPPLLTAFGVKVKG